MKELISIIQEFFLPLLTKFSFRQEDCALGFPDIS